MKLRKMIRVDKMDSKNLKKSSDQNTVLTRQSDVDSGVLKIFMAAVTVLSILSTVVFDKTKDLSGVRFPVFALTLVALAAVYLGVTKKLTTQNIILLMFSAGFAVRLNYVLITSVTARVRQHDVFPFGGTKGHSAYIEYFYNHGFTLPKSDPIARAQFYHPPLHHFLAALWMRLLTTFGMSYERAVASLPFLTLIYSMIALVVCERILDRLNLRGFSKIAPLAIMTFHPTAILLSGSINNDNLATLFTLLALYAAINWYYSPSTKNIIPVAAAIGLGMSVKLSAALIAPPIAMLFLIYLITEKKRLPVIKQYAVFSCVCFPLGLWYYIRNAVKFDIAINFVPMLPETSEQYIGNYSAAERLFGFSNHPFENVFLNRIATGADFYEYNPFVAIIKTSVFGEYNFVKYYSGITPYCRVLLVLNIIMIAISLIAGVYFLFRKTDKVDGVLRGFLIFYYALMMLFYFKFIFDYPHNCSMDFRYLVMTFIIGSVVIGVSIDQAEIDLSKRRRLLKAVKGVVLTSTVMFCFMSSLVYILIGLNK